MDTDGGVKQKEKPLTARSYPSSTFIACEIVRTLILVISSVFNAKYKHVGAMSYGEEKTSESTIATISSPNDV